MFVLLSLSGGFAPYRRFLYDISKATPRRAPTERQREAISKMRTALVEKYTCRGCGSYDTSHGQSRCDVAGGYCAACRQLLRHRRRQAKVCTWAKSYLEEEDFIVLDSETTGLGDGDEVIELALVHASGTVLFSSLIQPQDPQRSDLATHIHGITSQMLQCAPSFPEVWPTICAILRHYRRILVYNAAFDQRLLTVTASRYGLRLPGGTWELSDGTVRHLLQSVVLVSPFLHMAKAGGGLCRSGRHRRGRGPPRHRRCSFGARCPQGSGCSRPRGFSGSRA